MSIKAGKSHSANARLVKLALFFFPTYLLFLTLGDLGYADDRCF